MPIEIPLIDRGLVEFTDGPLGKLPHTLRENAHALSASFAEIMPVTVASRSAHLLLHLRAVLFRCSQAPNMMFRPTEFGDRFE